MEGHGEFKLVAHGNIVYAKLNGSWNKETAFRFSKEFKSLVEQSMPQRWAHFVCLNEWALGVPEFEPIIQELAEWCVSKGLVCAAQVFSHSLIAKYQANKIVADNSSDFSKKQFTDQKAAICWLRDKGFEIKSEILLNNFQ